MKFTSKAYNRVLVIFVLLTENCMYLVNTDKLNIAGVLNYNDMWAYLLLLYEFYYLSKVKMPKRYSYKFEVVAILMGCVVSSFRSGYVVGQPFMMGLRPQRFFIICFVAYFLVRKQLAVEKINVSNLLDLLVTAGIFEGILCTLQCLLNGHVQFLYAGSNIRYGSIRLYFDSGLIMFMTISGWCLFLKKGSKKYLLAVILGLVYEFVISKGRLENLCIIFSLFIAFVLLRKNAFRKVMVLITLITGFVLIMNTSYSKVLINTVMSSIGGNSSDVEDMSDTGDTMSIRKEGRKHYEEQSNKSTSNIILGCGYPNTLFEKSCEYARTDEFALVDNGILAYKFIYGWLGVVIVGITAFKALLQGIILYIKKGAIFPIAYIAFLVPIAYNIIFWWWKPDSTLLLAIYLAIVDHYFHDKCTNEDVIV